MHTQYLLSNPRWLTLKLFWFRLFITSCGISFPKDSLYMNHKTHSSIIICLHLHKFHFSRGPELQLHITLSPSGMNSVRLGIQCRFSFDKMPMPIQWLQHSLHLNWAFPHFMASAETDSCSKDVTSVSQNRSSENQRWLSSFVSLGSCVTLRTSLSCRTL